MAVETDSMTEGVEEGITTLSGAKKHVSSCRRFGNLPEEEETHRQDLEQLLVASWLPPPKW